MTRARDARGALGAARVGVVDADRALLGLLDGWLAEEGLRVVDARVGGALLHDYFDLIIVDVPYPRQGGTSVLKRIAIEHPRTPILALSSTFFSGVECNGPVAQALGVASVLAKPVKRDALVAAVRNLLRQ